MNGRPPSRVEWLKDRCILCGPEQGGWRGWCSGLFFSTLWGEEKRASCGRAATRPARQHQAKLSRSRVAEWPVTDPILRGWYGLKTSRCPSGSPRTPGESEQAPAVLTGPGQRLRRRSTLRPPVHYSDATRDDGCTRIA